MSESAASSSEPTTVFSGVQRGPRVMRINGKLRPAYEWCEMFGHTVLAGQCVRCGGLHNAAVRVEER